MGLITKICENCGKEYLIEYRIREQKCCSKKCSHEKRKLRKEYVLKCTKCGKEYKITTTEHKIKIGDYKKCCSNQCSKSRGWDEEHKRKLSVINKKSEKVKIANKKIGESLRKHKFPKITTCLHCGKDILDYRYGDNKNRKYHKECWLKISGGIRKGSSRGKSGYYEGYWCDSSYELAFVIYCLEHNKIIERNKEGFNYIYLDKSHTYFPDFRVDGSLVEIKNYRSKLTEAKLKSVNEKIEIFYKDTKIEIFYKDTMKPYLDYVKNKYGKNFIKLYNSN